MSEGKGAGAKALSKCAMLFSSCWIAVLTVLKGKGVVALEIDEIIFSGCAVTAIWCPTFVSMYLDKIKEIKDAGKR